MADPSEPSDGSAHDASPAQPPSAPVGTQASSTSKSPRPVVAVAVVLAAIIALVAFLSRGQPQTQPPTTQPSGQPTRQPSALPSMSRTAPTGAASTSPGPVPAPSGSARFRPVAIVGVQPTVDVATWAYVPGSFVIGAIKRIDGIPGLALTPAQWQQIAQVIEAARPIGKEQTLTSRALASKASELLTEQQYVAISASDEVSRSPLDVDAVIEAIQQSRASTPSPSPSVSGAPSANSGTVLPPILLLAGLGHLARTNQLSAEQASQLLPLVTAYVETLKAGAQLYARLPTVLNAKQYEALIQTLVDIREGTITAEEAEASLDALTEYMKSRTQ